MAALTWGLSIAFDVLACWVIDVAAPALRRRAIDVDWERGGAPEPAKESKVRNEGALCVKTFKFVV